MVVNNVGLLVNLLVVKFLIGFLGWILVYAIPACLNSDMNTLESLNVLHSCTKAKYRACKITLEIGYTDLYSILWQCLKSETIKGL